MLKLSESQLQEKLQFIERYLAAGNAADASTLDANANVVHKNIATMEAEIHKDINIQINRSLMCRKVEELFGTQMKDEYLRQIKDHEIYVHDETSLKPYCMSISMYPFLLNGMVDLGGESKAPKHLESYCGSFINLVFAVASQIAGAIATVEFLLYFDYFARKDYGRDYLQTHPDKVANHLQHVVYALNQPAAARGYQSVFWNISVYDRHYYESLFGHFVFPDGEKADWNSLKDLQSYFLSWLNVERTKALLTFPVVTAAFLHDKETCQDEEFVSMLSKELAEGNSFFMYLSDQADSLASCCRLRNEFTDNTFSYSLGAGGVSTGSINVITLNMNRLEQDGRDLKQEVEKIHCYQVAYRRIVEDYIHAGMLGIYKAGFIQLDKQFLTIGINGLCEAAESKGLTVGNNPEYKNFCTERLKVIFDANREARERYHVMFNTEFVPAENLGIKNAKWDAKDGYFVPRDCYNSYFYVVEDDSINTIDKFVLHGEEINRYLDGGSALHLNLEEYLSAEAFRKLIQLAIQTGVNYFTTNVRVTICNDCEHIEKRTLSSCSSCGSLDVDHATRIIGYLKRVSSFSEGRRKEAKLRYYHDPSKSKKSVSNPYPIHESIDADTLEVCEPLCCH